MATIEVFIKLDLSSPDWRLESAEAPVSGDGQSPAYVFTCFNSPGTPPLECVSASVCERDAEGIQRIREIAPAELGLVLSPEITHLKIPVRMDVSRIVGFWLQLQRLQPRR